MTWRTAALLMLAGVITACASEGGSRGSGISTLVRGNVISVQTAALRPALPAPPRSLSASIRTLTQIEPVAEASTMLEGIEVTIEGTSLHGQTDASGNFSIQGDFEGTFKLLFQRTTDALMAQLSSVTVPAGGTLTLNNISIEREVATAESQLADFDGIITAMDCGGPTIIMKSVQQDAADPGRYQMNLSDSTLQDSHGNAATCADLGVGQEITVREAEVTDGIFGGGVVRLVN